MSNTRRLWSPKVSGWGASWMLSGHAGIHRDTIVWTSGIGLHISFVYPSLSWQQSLTRASSSLSHECATLGPMRNILLPLHTHIRELLWGCLEPICLGWKPNCGSADHLAILEHFFLFLLPRLEGSLERRLLLPLSIQEGEVVTSPSDDKKRKDSEWFPLLSQPKIWQGMATGVERKS